MKHGEVSIAWCIVGGMDRYDQPEILRTSLRRWGSRKRRLDSERDPLILAALDAGLTREEVHVLTGLGRTTVDRIVNDARNPEVPL